MTRAAALLFACVTAACADTHGELEKLVAGARAHARAHAADPRVAPMTQLFERVTAVGPPRTMHVGSAPAALSVPLLAGTTTIATLYARLDGRAAIEWPHRTIARDDRSNLLPGKTFTILDAFPADRLPSVAFFAPPTATVTEPVMLDAIVLGQVVKVLGLPIRAGDEVRDQLPHARESDYAKQLKESAAWVARVNARPRARPWKTVTGPRSVSAKCWSYAFSFALDWWSRELGRPPGRYRSYLTGRGERGFDPRTLELAYRGAAAREPDRFLFVPDALLDDPVTGEPIPSNMDAFASLLVRKDAVRLEEPEIPELVGTRRVLDGRLLSMGATHRRLFHLNDGTFDGVVEALHKHGVVIAGEVHRHRGCPLYYSTHAVPIVGHTRIAGVPYLVYLDPRMSEGDDGPRLRAYPVSMFAEAYCFPHDLTIRARVARRAGGVVLRVRLENQAGRTLDGADRVELRASGRTRALRAAGEGYELTLTDAELADWGGRAVVHAEQRYYYGAAGTGVDLAVDLRPARRERHRDR